MTIEEKAKAYDEALERAKKWYYAPNADKIPTYANRIIKEIFPELKESKDEKIRKVIRGWINTKPASFFDNGISKEEMLAWIEKQGNKPQGKTALEAIHEEKVDNANKVEPKFHEGDYIKHNKANIIRKVISVNSGSYYVENIETGNRIELFSAEQNFHLWTIADAKDGDVLVYNNSSVEIILLFKKWMNGVGDVAYSYVHIFNNEILFNDWSDCGYTAHPATKEQRNILFSKMHKAGYMWDSENKQLLSLKAEPTMEIKGKNGGISPKWSEEDDKMLDSILFDFGLGRISTGSQDLWLKSIKERMGG